MEKIKSGLTEGSIIKGLFWFALPLLGSSLIQQLYNTVDLIFVGNFLGKSASAAVGSTSLVVTCIIGFFNGLGMGVGVLTAQFYGAGKKDRIKNTVHTAAGLTLILSVGITAIGLLLCPVILDLLQVPSDIRGLASEYLQIYMLGILSIVSYNMSAGILRALGNSRTPMLCQLFGGIVNVAGDALFICVLNLGVAGAGLATVLSQTLAAVLTIRYVCRLPESYNLEIRKIRVESGMAKMIFKIGIPEAVRSTMITFANLIVQTQINILGVNSMAAYASYTKAEGFLYLPQWAVGQACTTFVGQNLGAGQVKRTEKGARTAIIMAVCITMVISAFILVFPEQVFRLFSNEPEIVSLSARVGCATVGLYFLYGIVEVTSGAIRGAGHSTPPMVILLINMCGVRLIVLHILLQYFDTLERIILVFPITWVCSSLSMILYYRFGKWRTSNFLEDGKGRVAEN